VSVTRKVPANDGSKGAVNDLALFGGIPAFERALHVGCPNIGDKEGFLRRMNDMLDRRELTNYGPYVQEFERRIEDLLGVKHCVAVCNATSGLQLAIRALELKGEVIVPAFTFVATAHALEWQGITPVFCDIDPKTYTIDVSKVESLITSKTTGILGVHVWGHPCDVEGLANIAERFRLKLLFDAAHAFGCSHKGKMVAHFGDAEVFSFHATKFLNSFEGGAVVTNNTALAENIRLMSNFGFAGLDNVVHIGTNAKMSEVSAAMGLTSLARMEEFLDVNRRNYQTYLRELSVIPGLKAIRYDETQKSNFQYIVFEIDEQKTGITRDQLLSLLVAEKVIARRYFFPGCHRMEPYRSKLPDLTLPITEGLAHRVLCFPTGTSVGKSDISRIAEIIRFSLEHCEEIVLKMKLTIAEFAGVPTSREKGWSLSEAHTIA
jgi:dTDP-4-amino-4,6-dideoxygalactose transaminase